MFVILTLAFSYLIMFCKSHSYSKTQENAWLQQILCLFTSCHVTLLRDIDNRKLKSKLGAVYVIHFLFWLGCLLLFSLSNQAFCFTKNWLPGKRFGRLGLPGVS